MATAIRMRSLADPPVAGAAAAEAAVQPASLRNVEEVMTPPLAIKRHDVGGAPPMAPAIAQPAMGARLLGRLRTQLGSLALSVLSIGLLLGFWYLGTEYRWDFYIRFTNVPTPGEVYTEFMGLIGSAKFQANIGISLGRIMLGFCIATGLGVLLGLLCGRYALLKGLLFPALEVLRPIPAIAWVPISIMLWPTTETSIVFITFIGAFFPILLNTLHGVAAVDPVLIRAARCLGAGEVALMTRVILPGALPHIFTGLAVGMGVAWVSLIAAEMISGQFGVGYFTWEAYSLIEYTHIVIGML
ncbi:MAG: ABC transporter permease, partial [Parazoarcus communis]